MATGIELVINTLQALHLAQLQAAWPTLKSPPMDRYPTVLDTPNLPLLLAWPADGSWYVKGDGYAQDLRTIRVTGYVMPEAQNDIPSRAVQTVRLLEALRELYTSRTARQLIDPESNAQGLQATIESAEQAPLSDTGVSVAPVFEGVKYSGFVVNLRVRLLYPVN